MTWEVEEKEDPVVQVREGFSHQPVCSQALIKVRALDRGEAGFPELGSQKAGNK